jgi:beta-N-acetylhexosaminidase
MKMRHTNEQYPVGGIKAGVDIVLGPRDFIEAFDAVIAAVNNGTISEERINQSVRRILTLRLGMNRQIN